MSSDNQDAQIPNQQTVPQNDNQANEEEEYDQSLQFPSAELLLSAVQREYDKEDERAKTLESRVGILITLSAALLAFVSTYIKMPNFKKLKISNVYEALPHTFFISLLFLTMLILVFSLIYSVRIINIRSYKRIKIDDFEKINNLEDNPDIIASALITRYRKNIEHNQAINESKIVMYRRGTYCITASIILAVILYMLSLSLS
ncbi:hypothetical protein CN270_11440 [Priestia megaterium]|uniref:hypothetical protein n=1 Tax=Priestia megaterium TaxID=1404 RepID=UPI000BF92C85|nr:hypothetical protein [Priestia megaterium]PFE33927.1 hypothetical protein CN270_11440 [Priestia megaterium]